MKEALILFVKKPVEGKVKTRLGATIGHKDAVAVYYKLLTKVEQIITPLKQEVFVYSDEYFEGFFGSYKWFLQEGADLGEKMYQAFEEVFALGFEKVSIIGSDCFELTTKIIEESFCKSTSTVLGPSYDGGYYLLSLTQNDQEIFKTINWSTEKVRSQTIKQLELLSFSYTLLPVLTDIDDESDLELFPELLR
jgi:uncharacterized protein